MATRHPFGVSPKVGMYQPRPLRCTVRFTAESRKLDIVGTVQRPPMQQDSKRNWYEEIQVAGGVVRVTHIREGWDGTPSVRIQMWDPETKNLRQGPEIPIKAVGGLVGAIVDLLTHASQ